MQNLLKNLKDFLRNLNGWLEGEWYICEDGHRTHFRHFNYYYMYAVDNHLRTLSCKCGKPMFMANFGNVRSYGSFKITHGYYDHGLGMHINGASHRKSVIREQGLIEVGNENLAEINKKKRQADEKISTAKWTEGVLQELQKMGVEG